MGKIAVGDKVKTPSKQVGHFVGMYGGLAEVQFSYGFVCFPYESLKLVRKGG